MIELGKDMIKPFTPKRGIASRYFGDARKRRIGSEIF